MSKITITQNRDNCIGCGLCHSLSSETWKMNDEDGKADLMGAEKKGDLIVAEVAEELLDINKQIVDSCPAQIIKVVGYND